MSGNNSPILLTNVPQPIATFNRPFQLSELVDNLEGVMFIYGSNVVNVTCVSHEEEGQTVYALTYDNDHVIIAYLTVAGNTLLCTAGSSGSYLFDIDYNEQNKKAWTLNDGQYLLQMPTLVESSDTPLYAIARLDDGQFVIAINANDEPMATDAELTDIDAASWNADLSTAIVPNLMDLLLHMEYANVSSILHNGIIARTFGPFAIDGTFNPFTDGEPIEQ